MSENMIENLVSRKLLRIIRMILAIIILYYIVVRIIYPWNNKAHPLLYFTIQSNATCAIYWLIYPLVKKKDVRALLALATTTYMAITGIVFSVFLDVGFLEEVYTRLSDGRITDIIHYYSLVCSVITHYIMPILAFVDFILFTDTKKIKTRQTIMVLIYPLLYAIFHVSYSAITGKYIYPFFNPDYMGGTLIVIAFALLLAIIILFISYMIVVINRKAKSKIKAYYSKCNLYQKNYKAI